MKLPAESPGRIRLEAGNELVSGAVPADAPARIRLL